jgi:hypothetical protein
MITSQKKPFKLNVLGLFKWESEEWTVKEVALIMGMIMAFILIIIILLKVYAIPTLGAPVVLNQLGIGLGKMLKSRSP